MLTSHAMLAKQPYETPLGLRMQGPARLITPLLVIALIVLPFTWWLPLFRTELLVFLENDVTVIGAVQSLAEIDWFLCAIIVIFGMVIPFGKLAGLLYAWLILPADRGRVWIGILNKISKFSMLDVFLIAITIVGLKGVGLGKVEIAYGLYAFAAVVLTILGLSFWAQTLAARLQLA